MPCFAMICSCSMYLSCSKHCFLMINPWLIIDNFTKSETCYLSHFCHACLSLLLSEWAVAQCSCFVQNHEWIPAMYFVAMFECCSIFVTPRDQCARCRLVIRCCCRVITCVSCIAYHVIMCISFAYVFVSCIRAFSPLSVLQSGAPMPSDVPLSSLVVSGC